MNLAIPLFLILMGIIAIVLEIFVPAGGILGLFGGILVIASVINAYANNSLLIGNIFLIAGIITIPLLIMMTFKLFPKTYFGKKLILFSSLKSKSTDGSDIKTDEILEKEGITLTPLHPSGIVKIDNEKYNVITKGDYIDKDENVKVIKVEGNRIVVKKI